MSKINCPYHEDKTASMEVYPDGFAHCFGCGAHVASSTIDSGLLGPLKEKYVEPLDQTISYIKSLPRKQIRGLDLPYDASSYYILWPNEKYYNRRFFDVDEFGGKYKCPAGHQKSLFWAQREPGRRPLFIVEGEINALSVASVGSWDVCSPGGSGDFYSKSADKNLPEYLKYDNIVLIADKDKAGAIAVIQLKSNLVALGAKNVSIHLMELDANDILVIHGREKLKEEILKALGVPGRLQDNQGTL